MFKKLMKNKRGQNTAEYAILISLVVAGIIAMQTYAQRALQARVRGAAIYMTNMTNELGTTLQYEPYYLNSSYQSVREETDIEDLGVNRVSKSLNEYVNRTGERRTEYEGIGSEYNTEEIE